MQPFLDWIQSHAVIILLAWPIITALVNLAFGEAEKYAESHPRLHAILAALEAAGFDARGLLDALKKLVAKTPSAPAAMLVLVGVSCCVAANTTACSAQQTNTVIHDVTPAGACIVNALADGAVNDPMLIVAECAGTTIADVVQVIEDLLANPPASDGGAVGSSARDRYLREMLTKAHAIYSQAKLSAAR